MENAAPALDRAGQALYRQLYEYFIREIRTGRLAAGEKLPSRRRLAADAGVSVNTVDTAYGMLAAEGYVEARPRSGYVVCRLEARPAAPARRAPPPAPPRAAAPRWRFNFATSTIDTGLFPFKTWRRIQRDVLAQDPSLLNPGPRMGDENLRAAIAVHLHEYRGAVCTPEQVVIGAGIEYLAGLLAQMFRAETFAVEDPGYSRTARILANAGAQAAFVPVDSQGMDADALAASGARLAYVTPSHQFPTGVTMPAARRYELLRWAAAAPERWIIEDDYDSEFRFDSRPLPCLQGLDEAGRVIYIGTFSKSVAPAIRVAYMVLPAGLLGRWQAMYGSYSCPVSRMEQQTLCRFMESGAFARHLARLRIAYRRRRDALVQALHRRLGGAVRVYGAHTGLHLLAALPGAPGEKALVEAAAARGVHCTALGDYRQGLVPADAPDAAVPAAVLGYAGLSEGQIGPAVDALADAWGAWLPGAGG